MMPRKLAPHVLLAFAQYKSTHGHAPGADEVAFTLNARRPDVIHTMNALVRAGLLEPSWTDLTPEGHAIASATTWGVLPSLRPASARWPIAKSA